MAGGFKPGTLAVRWRPNHQGEGPGLVYYYPDTPADGHLLHSVFRRGETFAQDLEARGYDLTTLQFTIRKKDSDA